MQFDSVTRLTTADMSHHRTPLQNEICWLKCGHGLNSRMKETWQLATTRPSDNRRSRSRRQVRWEEWRSTTESSKAYQHHHYYPSFSYLIGKLSNQFCVVLLLLSLLFKLCLPHQARLLLSSLSVVTAQTCRRPMNVYQSIISSDKT